MVRKLALAVSLALGTLSVPVHALGLGELNSKSTLNQNFNGDIKLLSVQAEDLPLLRVKLADQDAFTRAGVDRPFFLSLLKFEPILGAGGKPVVRVTSDFPIREPFLNFLIEVNWPKGRLLREYTVLLDPPTTTRRRPPVVTPAAKAARPASPAAPAPKAATSAPSPAPVSAGQAVSASEYGPVQANDTAWGIAKKVRPRGVSMEQMMMALLDANPQAFINNDINRLRRGRILRVPSLDEIQQMSRAQARAAYRAQQDEWLARRDAKLQSAAQAKTEQTPDEAVDGAAATADPAADQLRIATARPEGQGEAGAGDDDAVSATSSDLKTRLIAARENAETSRQEAETLRSRVDDLQARLQDMQRLLSLKDEQLAQLQQNVVDAEVAGDAETPAPSLPLPGVDAPGDDVVLANQVDPDAIVEQTMQAAETAVGDPAAEATEPVADALQAPADVVIETPEAVTDTAAAALDDTAQAIDDAVADLVGSAPGVSEDYRIEDIAPQIDPDRIVLGEPVEQLLDIAPADDVSAAASDLDIAPQIDPDRIVLGLDAPAAVSDAPADGEILVGDGLAPPADTEIVVGDDSAGQQPAAAEPAALPEPEVAMVLPPTDVIPPVAEPAPLSPTADTAGTAGSPLTAMVEKNIVPIAAAGVGLLALLGFLFTRRRRSDEGEALPAAAGAGAMADVAAGAAADTGAAPVDEPILDPQALGDMPDSSFLDDFSPSDINALQDETGEVDPVSEADVYIAYGRYQQAEELLRQAMERDPDRLALRHKLLEVHYATRDVDAYSALAQDMVDAGQDSADEEAWSRAQDMGRELAPENPLFALGDDESSWRESGAGAAAAGAAAVAATDSVDSDSLSLEDLEISELTAAYEEETSALSELDPPSEVSITLDLDDASELAASPPPAPDVDVAAKTTSGLGDSAPLEFEMPDSDSEMVAEAPEDPMAETLDLDSMMAEAEKAVDQDNTEMSLDSDFSAAELQAQLDELSDLSALDSNLDDAQAPAASGDTGIGLVAEDTGRAEAGLDEPLSLDMAFDSANESADTETADVLELDSAPSGENDVATKLDLARAYVEMGDDDGARSILEEVVTEGSDTQRGEAKQLLANLG